MIELHGPSPVHRLSFAGVGQPFLPGFGQADGQTSAALA
jgi:hypothetical protein